MLNPIKRQNSFPKVQNMYIYCKNCKKHTEYTHPKILVLISNEKAKVKSQCAECLADRTFFDQINNKYDLEQLVKHFFLLMYFIKEHEDSLGEV